MDARDVRRWSLVHSWTSLLCTPFLLMLCLTGLPLVFHHELEDALDPSEWTPARPDGPLLSLDAILAEALARRPGEVPIFMSFDVDRPVVNVTTGPTADAPGPAMHFASFDRTSGALVPPRDDGGVLDFLLQLHTDLFLGLPGMLFLGSMGVLFLISVLSGVVLYAPFMRKHDFGVLRTERSARLRWLDWHDLTGIVLVAWVVVVGLTGVVNTLATPIVDYWKYDQLADLTAGRADGAPPAPEAFASLDAAVARAQAEAPEMQLQFVAFPGGDYSTPDHFAVFLHGDTPLTAHLITPALLDARTGAFIDLREMPWYVKTLGLSGPLHFGDYGGLALQIVWALLDVVTIVVLVSGLVLWVRRLRSTAPVPRELPAGALGAEAG